MSAEFPSADRVGMVLIFDILHTQLRQSPWPAVFEENLHQGAVDGTINTVERSKGMDEVGALTISPEVYGGLLSKTLPKVIETDRELEHFAAALESLDRLDCEFKPEEKLLEALLTRLIADYDEKIELPQLPPNKTIAFLMDQRGLKQADILPVFGSGSVASDILNGKREPGKSHIRKLAVFFRLSPDVFF